MKVFPQSRHLKSLKCILECIWRQPRLVNFLPQTSHTGRLLPSLWKWLRSSFVFTRLVRFDVLHEGTDALEYLSTYRTSTAVLLTCNRGVSARQRHSTLRLLAAIFSFQNLSSLRVCLCPFALHPLLTTAVALTLSYRAVWRKRGQFIRQSGLLVILPTLLNIRTRESIILLCLTVKIIQNNVSIIVSGERSVGPQLYSV